MIYLLEACSWIKGTGAQEFEKDGDCNDQLDTPALL